MAEREEKRNLKSGELTENAPEADESSASEYEEIIEEVTVSDYSDAEGDLGEVDENIADVKKVAENKLIDKEDKEKEKEKEETIKINTENKTKIVQTNEENSQKTSVTLDFVGECEAKTKTSVVDKTDTKSSNNDKEQQATSTTEKTETKEKDGAVVTTTTKVTTRTVSGAAKPVSPFAKFRQLDKQSSQQSPKSPSTPTTPGGKASPSSGSSARIFQFTDPALNARAATAKEQLLQWCQSKTQEYENIKITNFSASWSDGLAFCALIHHFLPDAFDYSKLTSKNRRHNFELAFTVADEKAGIAPLLDVEDMVEMQRPDWKCVFIYVQSIYRRFRNCQ